MFRRIVPALVLGLCLVLPARAEKITSMSVHVKTSNILLAGTDNDVWLVMIVQVDGFAPVKRSWFLDDPNHDDFEKGALNGFPLKESIPAETCQIKEISIVKSPDDDNGGWHLEFIELFVNGKTFHKTVANKWLEGGGLSWSDKALPDTVCKPPLPQNIDLGMATMPKSCKAQVIDGAGEPDADCDGLADKDDPAFDPKDSDGDGLCDACEDFNRNGVVDPGETDPTSDDSDEDGLPDLDDLADTDRDCLPDILEDRNRNGLHEQDLGETNWQNRDTDGDGWFDGSCNVRSALFLVEIECIDEQEDAGSDELFLTFNHTRRPAAGNLDGWWPIEAEETIAPFIEVARRTAGVGPTPGPQALSDFFVRIAVREDDVADFTDDDFLVDLDKNFKPNMSFTVPYKIEGGWDWTEYNFRFRAIQTFFADPNPLDGNADDDKDGIPESRESQNAATLSGVADPTQPDIYLELDSVGKDQMPERYTREDIATRFSDHGYAFHLDDGAFGGGQILGYEETLTLKGAAPSVLSHRKTDFAASRCGVFRYALAVDVVENAKGDDVLGNSDRVVKDASGNTICGSGNILLFKSDWLDHVSDAESIVWIHELGHTLGLCHLPGDIDEVVGTVGGCSAPPCSGCNCVHYTNDEWNDSAMGSGMRFPWIADGIQAIDREIDYDEKEWKAIDLTPIGGTAGCP